MTMSKEHIDAILYCFFKFAAYRGYIVRKAYGPLINKSTGQIDEETAAFLKRFAMKWKSRSIFQVLLQYRAVRYQDLVHFSQQVRYLYSTAY